MIDYVHLSKYYVIILTIGDTQLKTKNCKFCVFEIYNSINVHDLFLNL
jgi:hypothetical protein